MATVKEQIGFDFPPADKLIIRSALMVKRASILRSINSEFNPNVVDLRRAELVEIDRILLKVA